MRDSFMTPDLDHGDYYAVEANHGETHIVPADVAGIVDTYGELQDYVDGTIDEPDEPAELKTGWIFRLSAPGYMDATDWSVADTEQEALEQLLEFHGSQTGPEDMESWELDTQLRLLEIQGVGRFAVEEFSSGYQVRDRVTDATHWMSDGVDVFTSEEGEPEPPAIGTEEFRAAWEDALNADADSTLESYFPEQWERENG